MATQADYVDLNLEPLEESGVDDLVREMYFFLV